MNKNNFIYDGTDLFEFGQFGFYHNEYTNKPTFLIKDERIRQIICGYEHTFILKESGELLAYGLNDNGQLGLGDYCNRNIPTLLMEDNEIRQIVCGKHHTFILKNSGELFAFGSGQYGQLGLGDSYSRRTPTLLPLGDKATDKKIRQIICGADHSFILKNNGELYAFGDNTYGQLGLGDNFNRDTPTLLMQDEGIKQIVCGWWFTSILKHNGELFVFGYNGFGQLGLGDFESRNKPTLLITDKNIRQIVCGASFTFILKNNGELFGFGYNSCGKLGFDRDRNATNVPILMATQRLFNSSTKSLNKSSNPISIYETQNEQNIGIRQIICGQSHTFILKNNGELFVFGYNDCGQLGLGDNENRYKPTLLMTNENIKLINGAIIEKIVWNPSIFFTLSETKKQEIINFLLVCHYYKLVYKIRMVKYMKNVIIDLLF